MLSLGNDLLEEPEPVSNSNTALSSQRTLRPLDHSSGRRPLPAMRHYLLEAIAERLPCPYQVAGCEVALATCEVEEHARECFFRDMLCPLGTLNTCFWTGKLTQLMDHFRQNHPLNCNICNESDMQVSGICEDRDMHYVYLIAQTNMHFLITVKTATVDKAVHICIQYIGSKEEARRYIYEIHINSVHDAASRVVFVERCFNDTIQVDDIFRESKCVSIPLRKLRHYVEDEKLAFKFVIKKEAQSSALKKK
ncbi:hypothetical protein MSG28_005921 [Choristoneura fumiferana]|uniref:Uncharacterized protein n=1 Tax=Choristoneura fumiferana TaxID=7141 RepID=A0ACC0L1F3_CHOFU|nr:hypothetical protein MSG28_005921 [Choristoneura fumiferana]